MPILEILDDGDSAEPRIAQPVLQPPFGPERGLPIEEQPEPFIEAQRVDIGQVLLLQ